MAGKKKTVKVKPMDSIIQTVHGEKVILDSDLAHIYSVATKVLNQQVKRNRARFPPDFMIRLTQAEVEDILRSRSQFVTMKRGRNIKYLPYAFTESGAVMVANVLNSPDAVRMSVFVVRAFLKMREALNASPDLARELKKLEAQLTSRLDSHETAIVEILRRIMEILNPPPTPPEAPKPEIGFHTVRGANAMISTNAGKQRAVRNRREWG
jgi:phage regulator Rha-like protein